MNITPFAMETEFFERVTLGNKEAQKLLNDYGNMINMIDDIEDEQTTPEFRLATFNLAREVFTNPFFLRHLDALRQIDVNCTNAYADSVAWEKSDVEWKRQWSDHYRHFGSEFILAVAYILGGFAHMRSISQEIRTACWVKHHDHNGEMK